MVSSSGGIGGFLRLGCGSSFFWRRWWKKVIEMRREYYTKGTMKNVVAIVFTAALPLQTIRKVKWEFGVEWALFLFSKQTVFFNEKSQVRRNNWVMMS